MNLTDILNIQALDFDIWGIHVKANLMMSIIIVLIITACWFWNKYTNKKSQQLTENRKRPTWCQNCDISMKFIKSLTHSNRYECPKCGQYRLIDEHRK